MDRLEELARSLLRQRYLILASNRGPVEHHYIEGEIRITRGSGGVVTALGSLGRVVPFTWVASALGEADRQAAQMARGSYISIPLDNVSFRYVVSPSRMYHKYYNVFSNPFLWFLHHSLWDLTYTPEIDRSIYDAWDKGYVPVNRAFASVILEETLAREGSPVIMLHDYHLYLTGNMLRRALPEALILHFNHIPWPPSEYLTLVPKRIRSAILEGLCSCDIVGFQTGWDVRKFLLSCQDHLQGAEVDFSTSIVSFQGRNVQVRQYPVSIDVHELWDLAESSTVRKHEINLRRLTKGKTIVRVDRMDPSKNILRGFRAYELLLRRHPELLGKVNYLAFLVPSRTDIREYQIYTDQVLDLIQRVNATFKQRGWIPIHLFHQENYEQALAGMRLYDVLLVNPIIDGMNLVAKEGPIVNTKNGVVVLSERAGAYEQLGSAVIPVSPADVEETSVALYEALTMDEVKRVQMNKLLREMITKEDLTHWLYRQMEDLRLLVQ